MKTIPILSAWQALNDLAERRPDGWTLIGAQMVALHGLEHDREPPRAPADVDILVNARVVGQSVNDYSVFLQQQGFGLEGVSSEGIGHRFRKGEVSIDVLGPDGLKAGSQALLTIPPARTAQVPGGTQALKRTEFVDVVAGSAAGRLARPDLTGAILVKARAVGVDDVPRAQLLDLAFLLSLVDDPLAMRRQLSATERKWLRQREELSDPTAEPWRRLAEEDAAAGRATYGILVDR